MLKNCYLKWAKIAKFSESLQKIVKIKITTWLEKMNPLSRIIIGFFGNHTYILKNRAKFRLYL